MTCDTLDAVTRNLTMGNKTNDYNLDVDFQWLGGLVSDVIPDFHIGLAEGFGTTLGCFLTIKAALELQAFAEEGVLTIFGDCLLYTSPSPRDS